MIRKLVLGILAAASLSAAALAPSAASAHGFGWGWHGGFGHHYFGGPTFVVGGADYYDGCLQRRIIDTPRGPRLRYVNVCY
jgi:hypothetical protein